MIFRLSAFIFAVSASTAALAAPETILLSRLFAAPQTVEAEYTKETPPTEATPQEEHLARRAITSVRFHDTKNPDLRHLQNYDTAVAHIPKDPNGFPDWMRALREGVIKPRSSLSGKDVPSDELNLDIIMKNTQEMPWVRFPHLPHTQWLTCSNCHPYPFEARTNSTKIKMADIFRGQYCGMCHDRIAFITFFSCMRCHSVPQTTTLPAATPPARK